MFLSMKQSIANRPISAIITTDNTLSVQFIPFKKVSNNRKQYVVGTTLLVTYKDRVPTKYGDDLSAKPRIDTKE
ncbi:hypothetical protein O6P43_017012 [Quillaja saponaria]|uniref:Uncharacterized protein n=1 Tax=Quillaja saponaria TaxID=32244 RepID=A0AAD7LQN6_QUISA|nr:hypothetical protein O6P43_017012 [Quillaja saponaria]